MKKLFRLVMAAAVIFSVASCAKEDISTTLGKGQVEVTFTANLADLSTRTIGDGMTVDQVYLAVYEKGGTKALESSKLSGTAVVNGKATINVVLLKDKTYDLVFWAQNNAANAYDITALADGRTIKANYAEVSNLENRDAFCLVRNNYKAGHDETTFSLKRPFAQINVANSDADVEYIKDNGAVIEKSKMVVKTKVRNTLNMLKETPELAGELVDVTFESNAIPAEDFYKDGYNYLAMNYLLVNERELVDLEFVFTDDKDVNYTRKYFQVPVQRNYRTNILGQIISSPYDFNVEIVPGFDGEENPDISIVTFNDVDTDAELLTALTVSEDHVKHIIVNLTGDVTYDVDAWQACAMGGKLTEDITINGNNNTLTFNHNNTDWNNVVTNGAKLVLNNLNLTNSGKNDGPWNRHDITFNCPVELNNVTSDKAIALSENAVLKNVTIVETGDVYGLWIRAKEATVRSAAGISVEIDGLSIESGRAIKIADEYIDNPACVSLSVKNAKFKTNKKAAILVTSTAGANIVWGDGNDISEVAADNVFAVWVDEERKAYAHLVEVSGADVRLEDAAVVDTQDELTAAIAAGGHIMLAEGEYTFNETAKDITIIGTGNVANIILNQVDKTPNCSGKNVSFENITFKNGTANYKGIQHSGDVSYKNCVIEGQIFLYGTSETFEGCTFKVTGNVYNVWTYGAGNVTFKNCEFNCEGKSLLIYHESAKVYNVTVDDCTFKSTVTKDDKSAIQMHTEYGITGVLKINDTTATGFANINNGLWNELNNQTGVLTNVFEKYVDGVRVYNDVVVNTDKSVYTIYSAAGLKWFANEVNVNNQTFDGKTVKLANDIDLNNELWTPIGQTGAKTFNGVFDGQNHTISNLNVDSSSQTGKDYSSGLFGWVESHTAGHGHLKNVKISGANITGHHNCGALVGYITEETALVENCHVTGATISCTHANGDADGDKAGALIGNATVATPVKDCTATDSTVSAGRDAGQVIGAAKEANVTGCSATNVTVTANCTSTGANINNAVIGRLL